MAQNKKFRFGPIALTNVTTTNLLNPGTLTGGVNMGSGNMYILLSHIRVVNKTGSPATVSLWIGATGANAAGTEFSWQGTSVPANSAIDWFGAPLRFDTTDFLVGGASANTALTIEGEGEIGVAA